MMHLVCSCAVRESEKHELRVIRHVIHNVEEGIEEEREEKSSKMHSGDAKHDFQRDPEHAQTD